MGTVAITNRVDDVQDNLRVVECTVTGSASYATGGDTIPAIGLREITRMVVLHDQGSGGQKDKRGNAAPVYNGRAIVLGGTPTARNLALYDAGVQVANAVNTSTHVWRVRFLGS